MMQTAAAGNYCSWRYVVGQRLRQARDHGLGVFQRVCDAFGASVLRAVVFDEHMQPLQQIVITSIVICDALENRVFLLQYSSFGHAEPFLRLFMQQHESSCMCLMMTPPGPISRSMKGPPVEGLGFRV